MMELLQDEDNDGGNSGGVNNSGNESLLKMNFEDAEYLERGVRDSCSSGRTPVFLPIDHPSSPTETLSLDEKNSPSKTVIPQSKSTTATSKSKHERSNSESSSSKLFFRRCLSGDIRVTAAIDFAIDSIDSKKPQSEVGSVAFSPVSVAEDVQQATTTSTAATVTPEPPQLNLQIPETTSKDNSDTVIECKIQGKEKPQAEGIQFRSKSFDRRLSEAAQFAAAVGELPPANESEVQVIIEESESDDDDSDIDIVVETAASSHTSFRSKTRPRWPFSPTPVTDKPIFLFKLPEQTETPDFVYKGICSNPPEITFRGISRGNYAQLHRKAWLEVSDKYHRYGKNLRLYYRHWERLGYPTNQFFDWLDSKGEAAGQPLPYLDDCPRSQLDSDTVLYITNPDVTEGYALTVVSQEDGRALVLDVDGDPVQTGSEGWIFVLRDNTLYGAKKITSVTGRSKQRFHHSSFFSGKAVAAAGIILTDEDGYLTRLYPHSGHYRPGEADMQRMLFHLHHHGVDFRTFEMDTQQILHVTRLNPNGEQKKKKTQSLHLKAAVYVACFLAHKAQFIANGVFDQIHILRKANVTRVSEALEEVDQGGFWANYNKCCLE